jgi:hypothetical protein
LRDNAESTNGERFEPVNDLALVLRATLAMPGRMMFSHR